MTVEQENVAKELADARRTLESQSVQIQQLQSTNHDSLVKSLCRSN